MMLRSISNRIQYTLKWLGLASLTGVLCGSASALFLIALQQVTVFRQGNSWLFYFLPLGGLLVGLLYHYLGKEVEKGNNQIIDEVIEPRQQISWRMAPLVLMSTLLTHVVGGSAGREGTAVQMGGSIADQLNILFPFKAEDRRILLMCGVSAGFASVFGTPLAGTIFALEVYIIGKMRYEALVPALFSALIADWVCVLWGAHHTHYAILSDTPFSIPTLLYSMVSGLLFAGTAWLFSNAVPIFKKYFNKIAYPPLRPVAGGLVLLVIYVVFRPAQAFAGLGIETIVQSFTVPQQWYVFLLKLVFTAFTLAAGFKGGEVTPLFFIGATLGSLLSVYIPLPIDLLAAMGFVAVFAAAANTPLACVLMGIELFGIEHGVFMAIACLVAYLFSGHSGIYSSQLVGSRKGG